MDELFETIMKAAMSDAMKNKRNENNKVDMLSEAKRIAELNKTLFDAHVASGFDEDQALALVIAINN